MRKIAEGEMEKFGTLDSSEKTIATLGDRWWAQTAKPEGDKTSQKLLRNKCKKNVISAQMLERCP